MAQLKDAALTGRFRTLVWAGDTSDPDIICVDHRAGTITRRLKRNVNFLIPT